MGKTLAILCGLILTGCGGEKAPYSIEEAKITVNNGRIAVYQKSESLTYIDLETNKTSVGELEKFDFDKKLDSDDESKKKVEI